MKLGKAFELFIKHILINVGFSNVKSDGLYIFDGAPGQMIQGLGEAHNADVLLEPPVQTPFFSRTRLLIECKDYKGKVGLNTIRSALGLREDINHFDIVDLKRLCERRKQKRRSIVYDYERYSYQVAVASMAGFTLQAQEFAASHRIPLLEFNKMPFWNKFLKLFQYSSLNKDEFISYYHIGKISEEEIIRFANEIGQRIAVAVTNSGQLLFLYRITREENRFDGYYTLHWQDKKDAWILKSGDYIYLFQLPDNIMRNWIESAANDFELKREALNYKERMFSNMIVYYSEYYKPVVKMISIDEDQLKEAKEKLFNQ